MAPVVTITAPTKLSNTGITDTTITITDNGIGRQATIKSKPKKHLSVAMTNIEARLEMLNAIMEKEEFSVSIVDLETKSEPTGTKVVLLFPNDLH